MTAAGRLGFIGLGVMGEPMCRNLAKKSGAPVVAFDARPEPLEALRREGVESAPSATQVAEHADTIFLCLPGDESCGLTLKQAGTARRLLERTAAMGWSDAYYTAVIKVIERH